MRLACPSILVALLACSQAEPAACPAPLLACGEGCVDPRSDPAHCGDCSTACGPGQACLSGGCVATCEGAGGTLCGGQCVSLASDDAHCGACDHGCVEGQRCEASSCVSSDCPVRTGGAFVTFAVCAPAGSSAGSSFKAWVTREPFIAEAEQLLVSGTPKIPVFEVRSGADCDGQWSWHVDPATPGFADFTVEVCDACPPYVEAHVGDFESVGWCPWIARVVAVDRRP